MSFPVLKLPKDLIQKLLHQHLDGLSALRLMMSCKRFYQLSDRKIIIEKVLRYYGELEFQKQLEELTICEKCKAVLPEGRKSLASHLHKHVVKERAGKELICFRPFTTRKCQTCQCTVSNYTYHNCRMRKVPCFCGSIIYRQNTELLCPEPEFYADDPAQYYWKCLAKCKICKKNYVLQYNPNHYQSCELKNFLAQLKFIHENLSLEEMTEYQKTPE